MSGWLRDFERQVRAEGARAARARIEDQVRALRCDLHPRSGPPTYHAEAGGLVFCCEQLAERTMDHLETQGYRVDR